MKVRTFENIDATYQKEEDKAFLKSRRTKTDASRTKTQLIAKQDGQDVSGFGVGVIGKRHTPHGQTIKK
jgi:hypothetical protein